MFTNRLHVQSFTPLNALRSPQKTCFGALRTGEGAKKTFEALRKTNIWCSENLASPSEDLRRC